MELTVAGSPVHAYTGGVDFDPALPALLFLHGAGMDHTVWQQQARYLAHHGFGVLAVDLPGHGSSGGAALDSIGALADWTAEAVAAAGLAKATLIGHSMGAISALEAASRHPTAVARLALLGAAAKMPVHPDLLKAAAEDPSRAAEMIVGWAHAGPAHRGGNAVPGLWMTAGGRRLLAMAAPGVLAADLAACDAYATGEAAARKVACPTLLLLGEGDMMTPVRAAAPLVEAIPDCRRVVLPGAGHMMMVEAPRATLDTLRRFLAETEPKTADEEAS